MLQPGAALICASAKTQLPTSLPGGRASPREQLDEPRHRIDGLRRAPRRCCSAQYGPADSSGVFDRRLGAETGWQSRVVGFCSDTVGGFRSDTVREVSRGGKAALSDAFQSGSWSLSRCQYRFC